MMRNSLVVAGFGAVVALGLIQYGCSSTSNSGAGGSSGQGGSTSGLGGSTSGLGGSTTSGAGGSTTSGAGGSTSGAGGSTTSGAGGSAAGTGGSAGGLPICAPAPADKSACTQGAATCTKNCGANISAISAVRAQKPCACNLNATTALYAWDCSNAGPCTYPTAATAMAACFHIPTPPVACPMDTGALLRPHLSVCTNTGGATCGQVCGSTTVASYQDSSAAPKIGYCSCITGLWECASVAEWPPGI